MTRLLRIFGIGIAVAVGVVPAASAAEIRGVDATAYPEIRLSVVSSTATSSSPRLTENGEAVAGLVAENLGRAKSVAVAVDRSQSMEGEAFSDAVAAARAFVAAKPGQDRISVLAFGSDEVALTGFSTSTTDVDAALRTLAVDAARGTALYDAIMLAANSLAAEPLPGRVIVLLTDGADAGSKASFTEAIAAAREAGAAVYPIALEAPGFSPAPLREIAEKTGGAYYGAASSEALEEIYASIAEELKRTWRLGYVTAARPGEELALEAKAGGESARATIDLPGSAPVTSGREPSPLLPAQFLESWWGAVAIGAAVALIMLVASAFAFASPKGAWLRARLSPHVGAEARATRAKEGERLAAAAPLFQATEKTFGHLAFWKKLHTMLDRADMPLRTVEFVYLMSGSAVFVGLIVAVIGPPMPFVFAALCGGAFLPYAYVALKGRRRLKAFENQLPDLLTTVAASLKAGHSFRQGIQAVVDEGAEPASKEFKRVLAETRLGRPMDAALAEMSRRVGSKNLEFVLTAVTIQRQVGGSLAGIFDMVADTVRNRHQFARKVKGLTAMGRASAYVLIALPFFVAGAITLINAEYMRPLWHTSTGHKMLITMLVMMAVGSMILRKIVSFRG
jgi:tight adherence protein B